MCFLLKEPFDDDKKKIIYMIYFLYQTKNSLPNMLKLLEISGFLVIFVQNSRFFKV